VNAARKAKVAERDVAVRGRIGCQQIQDDACQPGRDDVGPGPRPFATPTALDNGQRSPRKRLKTP
jgi:hypothetical protein